MCVCGLCVCVFVCVVCGGVSVGVSVGIPNIRKNSSTILYSGIIVKCGITPVNVVGMCYVCLCGIMGLFLYCFPFIYHPKHIQETYASLIIIHNIPAPQCFPIIFRHTV